MNSNANSAVKGWDRQEVYVLTALQELKDNQRDFKMEMIDIKESIAEVTKSITALHGKFDQYNNFNQRLFQFDNKLIEKQKELGDLKDKLAEQIRETSNLKVRVLYIAGGISIGVAALLNFILDNAGKLFSG
jgi:chromosome segregation ATPase